jgi:GT2 family glycosyltransferase
MMKLGYICTNYNNSSYTLEAVRSLKANTSHQYNIVVVDNNSDAESVAFLKEMASVHRDVHLILSDDNVGYFRGLNLGIRYLREQYPELQWMIVGNNDLEFPVDFADKLSLLVPMLQTHAVISPDIVTVEGAHQNPHVIESISKLREVFYDLYYANYYAGMAIMKLAKMLPSLSERSDEEQWQVARPIYQGHGSCYVLGPRFLEQFSELWAPTFMMSEEYFLSKQLSDVGQQVYYEPGIQVVHHWHGSLEKLPSRRRWNLAREAHREYRKYVKIFG